MQRGKKKNAIEPVQLTTLEKSQNFFVAPSLKVSSNVKYSETAKQITDDATKTKENNICFWISVCVFQSIFFLLPSVMSLKKRRNMQEIQVVTKAANELYADGQ